MTRKPAAYYEANRSAFLEWVNGSPRSILDVGCAAGLNGVWFRERGASLVVGVELDPASADVARATYDRVLAEPIESAIPRIRETFDLILCADVLEHLVDPWSVVRDLRQLATPETRLAVSIPNVRHGAALWRLAFGRGFEYETEGTFDRTHLRFFTRSNVAAMLEQGGWTIERWGRGLRSRRARALSRLTARRADEWLAYQWYVTARPRAAQASPR